MNPQQLEKLNHEVATMPSHQQEQVADFVAFLKTKSRPRGTPGHTLRRFIGSIPSEDLKEMMDAIEEGCGQIDKEGWD